MSVDFDLKKWFEVNMKDRVGALHEDLTAAGIPHVLLFTLADTDGEEKHAVLAANGDYTQGHTSSMGAMMVRYLEDECTEGE
jgi:hypothetical protein